MRTLIEETKRRLHYLKERGFTRDHSGFWCGNGMTRLGFQSAWKCLMNGEGKYDDWTPPSYYEHLDCDGCRDSHLVEISRAIKEALRKTINKNCACGGRAPDDPECCPACCAWHDLYPANKNIIG
jgi:hypothetical protein